jgi:hypothetical protein
MFFWKVYKLTKNGMKPKWSFKKSNKPMYAAVDTTMIVTIDEAIRRWGTNKWAWPTEPYTIKGFHKYRTPADVERDNAKP